MNNKYLINDQIHDQKVFVIDENGKNLGVMMTTEAIKLANSKDYDLVLFASAEKTKNLAICKIIKYDKFLYQQQIKLKEAKKKQSVVVSKEVKIKPQIGSNDLQ
ncbi:translation initiation factor IF-3 [bacterium]|nr:translation initiation factor IF-3 [bacterium]